MQYITKLRKNGSILEIKSIDKMYIENVSSLIFSSSAIIIIKKKEKVMNSYLYRNPLTKNKSFTFLLTKIPNLAPEEITNEMNLGALKKFKTADP